MPFGKRQRRFLISLGIVAAAVIVLLLALPVWCPWLLRPLAKGQGVHYASYERAGYGRFTLHEVTFTNQTIHFHAEQIHALVPTVWLWHCLGTEQAPKPFLTVKGWQLESFPGEKASGRGDGIYTTFQGAMAI